MFRLSLVVGALAGLVAAESSVEREMAALGLSESDGVLSLNLPATAAHADAFEKTFDKIAADFDVDTYHKLLAQLEVGLENYQSSAAFNGYKTIPGQPHCDRGTVSPSLKRAMGAKAVAAFPGGPMRRLFGFDLGKLVFNLAQKAAGPAAASGGMGGILAMQALTMGAGMLQTGVASAIHIIPPLVIGQPLTCVPMLTGHNCFGAVLHPITMADFVIADVTDSMVDGYIMGFPQTYATKVGKTSDAMYKACFSAYMSMHCSSLFPRCTAPNSRNEPVPAVGRVPMCFHMCLSTLVMCPGFWVEDILGPCQMVAAPPTCSMAVFWNMWRLPPQYVTYEDSHPTPLECPKTDASFEVANAESDYGLYDSGRNAIAAAAGSGAAGSSGTIEAGGAEGATGATTTIKVPNA